MAVYDRTLWFTIGDLRMWRLTFREAVQDEILVLRGMRLRKHDEKITAAQGRRRRMLLLLLSGCLYRYRGAGIRRARRRILFDVRRHGALSSSSSSSTLPGGVRGTHCCNIVIEVIWLIDINTKKLILFNIDRN